MKNKTKILSIALSVVGLFIYAYLHWVPPRTDALQLTMLNIGQGDALYIRTPLGNDILIDGGPDRSVLYELGEVMPPYDHTIEWVFTSHPDADHINGITQLGESYRIGTLVTNGETKQTAMSEALQALEANHKQIVHAGDRVEIESDVWFNILAPTIPYTFYDANDNSIVMTLHYKNVTALFTGDASIKTEEALVLQYPLLLTDVDLLKVGHHGSKTSTSDAFLDVLRPEIAMISVGKGNRYGHPHYGTLHRLQERNIEIWRTDTDGRVKCSIREEIICETPH